MALNPSFVSHSSRPLPLAYGYVLGIGDRTLSTITSPTVAEPTSVQAALYLMGEGEWDGVELFAPQTQSQLDNGYFGTLTKAQYLAGITQYLHFHGGSYTTKGIGNALTSVGPDQGYDEWFSYFPSVAPPQSYSGIAYALVSGPYTITQGAGSTLRTLTAFPLAPMGVWRSMRCRIFDAYGNVTAYGFTTNPAWHFIDAQLRLKIKPQQPGLAGLTDAEKACFNWESIVETAARNDVILANGRPRFMGSYIFAADSTLANVNETILRVSRSYQRVSGGQICLIGDDPRPSVFLMGANNIVPGTLKLGKKDISKSPNVFVPQYRDIDIPAVCQVTNAQTSIESLNGVPVSYTVFTLSTLSPFVDEDLITYGGADDADFDGHYRVVAAFVSITLGGVSSPVTDGANQVRCNGPGTSSPNASTTGGYLGTSNARFSERAPTNVLHRSHQHLVSMQAPGLAVQPRIIPVQYDCGNCTFDQTNRLMKFERDSTLGTDIGAGWTAPVAGSLTGWLEAVDVNGKPLISVESNDVITLDDWVTPEFTGDYKVTDRAITPPSGSSLGQIALQLTQYNRNAYTDVSDDPGESYATVPSVDLPFGTFPVNNAAWVLEATPLNAIDPATGKLTVTIPDLSIQWMGKSAPTLYPTASWSGLTPGSPYVLYVDDPAGTGVGASYGSQAGSLPLTNDPAGRCPVLWGTFNANSILLSPVNVSCYVGGQNYSGAGAPIGTTFTSTSLIVNQIYNDWPIKGYEGDTLQGWAISPPQAIQQDAAGNYTGTIAFPGKGNQTDTNFRGTLMVETAGVYTFYFRVDDSWVFWLGNGASLVKSGINTGNGASASIASIASKSGLGAPLAGRLNRGLTIEATDYVVVNLPAPGTYPFEIGWGNDSGNLYFECTCAAGNVPTQLAADGSTWGSTILPAPLVP